MKTSGIHYDVGTSTLEGASTRPTLTVAQIEQDIDDIAHGLHANAVRLTGGDVARLTSAGAIAAARGLDVWLSPMLPDADASATLACIDGSARSAEVLRQEGRQTVLVLGCELSVFMSGILPGATHGDRLALLADPARLMAEVSATGLDPQATFAAFLRTAVETARASFNGPITYASGAWEEVDWSAFDFVGIDAYRSAANRDAFPDTLRELSRHGRPVAITEFGCATYHGAADAGGMAWAAVERAAHPRRLREGIVRDESEQANEIAALIDAAETSGVEAAFVYTYVAPSYPSSTDPAYDLDAASFALVRSWPDGRTEPKAAYHVVARAFAGLHA